MDAPDAVKELVERFQRNLDAYRSGRYNETQVRREFVDPFFEALGWDVTNKQGYAEAYKDVIHEDSIRIGALVKAPDYCFRIGGTRKFFLETKKPSVNIKDDIHPAYQLRRYAWSAKLPLSILTDFEEFAVYDCRTRPVQSDKASKSRIMYLRFEEYLDKWDEIAGIFARDAILKGSFDRFADSAKGKRGTAEVDDEFLKEIESWREMLARNIALRNPRLSTRELNFAVQRTIDRLVFLRICEDRGIEPYGRLQALGNAGRIYPRLCEQFRAADDRYNSGLFHFRSDKGRTDTPDELSLSLTIDDKILKGILKRMYYPESPYEFSVLPADILGQVYERFLGKVIRLTAGHQAKIEEKPEVRKAGGVYYTPTYIVDYIVKNTVGKLLEGVTPRKAATLRVLDPACGSGSFLIGAYQYLMDWHRDWYVGDGPEKHAKGKAAKLYEGRGGEWKLTTAERKRILINNIYGVDIDQQAVEVTKLSLLLKVLEGESEQTLSNQLMLFNERALPDLGSNIKCGNSLIGPDYYDTGQPELFDIEETYRINAFDWEAEFPEILTTENTEGTERRGKGGFDAVIGNPPYLGGRDWKKDHPFQYSYFLKRYSVAEYQFDMYVLFWQQACELTRIGSRVGLITPNTWLNNKGCLRLRSYLLTGFSFESIIDYSRTNVFHDAVVLPIVTILTRGYQDGHRVSIVLPTEGRLVESRTIAQATWSCDDEKIINVDLNEVDIALRQKIERQTVPLGDLATVKFGIKLYETGKGTPPQAASAAKEKTFEASRQLDGSYRRYLEGKDVVRYATSWRNRWLKYGPNLAAPRDPALFHGERVLVRRIVGTTLISTYVDDDYVTSQLLQIVKPSSQGSGCYLTGILNSRLLAYYFRKRYNRQDKTFPEIRVYELRSLPIRTIDFDNPAEVAQHDKMVALVERMLELNRQLQTAKTTHDKTMLQRQIDATDKKIDKLVYELYDLTQEEIEIVEGNAK